MKRGKIAEIQLCEEWKRNGIARFSATNPRWIADDGENIVAAAGR
jgi:hypothetical protein